MNSFRSKYLIILKEMPLHLSAFCSKNIDFEVQKIGAFCPKRHRKKGRRANGACLWCNPMESGLASQISCDSIRSYAPGCARLLRSEAALRFLELFWPPYFCKAICSTGRNELAQSELSSSCSINLVASS